ncbi:MAG: cytochrome c nitrite reductase small subunit [Ignavibacteriaceae bacterium]|nr:cytochrome c nitrite reductase small subunit [Ignavibacteriaceae bacterium]
MTKVQNRFRGLIEAFTPPPKFRIPVILLLGVLAGLLLVTFHISNAASYISDDPKACVNCHIMAPYYATWERGSHGRVTVCNDCHVPQDNIFNKYYFKASDGARHATMFTLRLEPQVIRIHKAGRDAVQANCVRCHENAIHPVSLRGFSDKKTIASDETYCWDCHREVPHGRVNSLSSTPYARVPRLEPVIPEWINNYIYSKGNNQSGAINE